MSLLTLLLPLAVTMTQAPTKPAPDKVLASVNGVSIRASQIEDALWDWRAFEVGQEFIVAEVIKQAAQKLSVFVTDAEATKAAEDQMKLLVGRVPEGQTISTFMQSQGYSKSRFLIQAKSQLLLDKIAEATFDAKSWVQVSTIAFRPKSELTSDLAASIKDADTAFNKLKAGGKWTDVLKSTTDDPKMIEANGNVGWVPLEMFPAKAQEELQKIKVNEYTHPVQTQYGLQIFRLDAKGGEIKGDQLRELKNRYLAGARTNTLRKLMTEAKIERFFPDADK